MIHYKALLIFSNYNESEAIHQSQTSDIIYHSLEAFRLISLYKSISSSYFKINMNEQNYFNIISYNLS